MIESQPERLPKRVSELLAARETVLRCLRQGPGEHLVYGRRQVRPHRGHRRGRAVEVGPDGCPAFVAVEDRRFGQQLKSYTRQRVLIRPPVDGQPLDLLRCDVIRRAKELARGGQPGRLHSLAEPEVREVDVIRPARMGVKEHVRWLDVPVHQAGGVRGIERGRHRRDDRRGPRRLQRALPAQQGADVSAAHESHCDEEHAAGLAGFVYRDDVRMVHRGRRPRLPGEALAEHRIGGHRGSHDLQRHQPAQALITSPVHHGHPAGTNLLF